MKETEFKQKFVKHIQVHWPDAFTHPLRDGFAQAGATQGPRPGDILFWYGSRGYAIELKLIKDWPVRPDSIALPSEQFSLNQASSLDKIMRTGNVGVGVVWFLNKKMGVDFAIVVLPKQMRQNYTRHDVLTKFKPFVREDKIWPVPDMFALDGKVK